MNQVRNSSHLRLIFNNRGDCVAPKQRRKPQQLNLPYLDAQTAFFVDVTELSSSSFLALIQRARPSCVIDARASPRLDILAGTRANAFRVFTAHNIQYVDLFGRLSLNSYSKVEANPIYWKHLISELMRDQPRPGHIFFLFDDKKLMNLATDVLASSLRLASGQKLQIAIALPFQEFA